MDCFPFAHKSNRFPQIRQSDWPGVTHPSPVNAVWSKAPFLWPKSVFQEDLLRGVLRDQSGSLNTPLGLYLKLVQHLPPGSHQGSPQAPGPFWDDCGLPMASALSSLGHSPASPLGQVVSNNPSAVTESLPHSAAGPLFSLLSLLLLHSSHHGMSNSLLSFFMKRWWENLWFISEM